jgi:hypothetical protein
MNPDQIGGNRKQLKRKSMWAAPATAMLVAMVAASFAFIGAAQAQQPPKKPSAPAARPAPAPAPRAAAPPAARPAPAPRAAAPVSAPRAIARPSAPPPQRSVSRPLPPQRTVIPNRAITQPQNTTRIRPDTRGPRGPSQAGPSQGGPAQGGPAQGGPAQIGQGRIGPNGRSGQRTITQGPRGPRGPSQGGPAQAGLSPTGLRFGPHGPNATLDHLRQGPNALRQPRFPSVTVNNRFFPITRGEKFVHMGGRNRFFVPLSTLGAVEIGGTYWNPDGYVSTAAPFCAGYTPDGCELHWRVVDFVDGGGEPQCVQYCPIAGPPPARVATLPPPLPRPAQGTCQVTIFSDPNFAGTSAPTGDNQPNLSESGWQSEISSIQVQSGTWDFFTDDDYGGNTMRLTAGTYPALTPDWNKKINSFMCVEPGPGA